MARFRCAACGQEGEFAYDPKRHACPVCGSSDVVFALPMEELPDELIEVLLRAEPLDNDENDGD